MSSSKTQAANDSCDRVFFDGACAICSREISALKNKVGTSNVNFAFSNVHECDELPTDKIALLKELHVYRANGQKLVGLDANIYMWQKSGLGILARIMRNPLVYPPANFIYGLWAKRRYNKLYSR